MFECDGQMNIFDFIESEQKNEQEHPISKFNPLEALALCGTGFVDGMKRVHKYFLENHTMQEKAKFLKKEYGLGGYGSPIKKPCYIHDMNTFGNNHNDIVFSYYDENINNINTSCSWGELAKTIMDMISQDKYIYKDGN